MNGTPLLTCLWCLPGDAPAPMFIDPLTLCPEHFAEYNEVEQDKIEVE